MSVTVGTVVLPNPDLDDSDQYLPVKTIKRTMADTYRTYRRTAARKLLNLNFTDVKRDDAMLLGDYIEANFANTFTYTDYRADDHTCRFTNPTFEYDEYGLDMTSFSLTLEVMDV